jgi:hypothetical protein
MKTNSPIRILSTLLLFFVTIKVQGQTILEADGPGNTYSLINSRLAPGYNVVEVPDCGHPEFGPHIDEVFDNELNRNVFRFHIHVDEDDDRCISFDRQRNEIKTYDKSPKNLLGTEGETVQYKWKFKLDKDFQSSANFTHIHQLKAVGGSEEDMPLITLTTRLGSPDRLELRYAEALSQTTLASTNLTPFKGQWVEVIETVKYGENGTYDIKIINAITKDPLFSFSDNSIRMWKTDADFIRPKWGIYRSLLNAEVLRDEIVLFSSFSINENILSSTEEEENELSNEIIYQPISKKIIITNSNQRVISFELYNINGTLIKSKTNEWEKEIQIDASTLASGFYLVRLNNNLNNSSKKMFIF